MRHITLRQGILLRCSRPRIGEPQFLFWRRPGDLALTPHPLDHLTPGPALLAGNGRGYGSQLAKYVLDDARERGLKVIPSCPFLDRYITKHPEYEDLRA